jgi:hypothetical protein
MVIRQAGSKIILTVLFAFVLVAVLDPFDLL